MYSSRRLSRIQALAALFLLVLIVMLSNAEKLKWTSSVVVMGNSANKQLANWAATPEPITAEPLTLTSSGFFPRAFTHHKSRFILVVNNRTEQAEINLTLSRDIGNGNREKQKDAKILRNQPDWNDIIDLAPGEYVLSEASNPKWVCHITITSK